MPTPYEPTVKGAPEDLHPGQPSPTDKKYVDIIKSDVEDIDPKLMEGTGIPANIVYYCSDCKALIEPKRIGKKFRFSCMKCKGSNVAFGTKKSIVNYYRLPESESEEK